MFLIQAALLAFTCAVAEGAMKCTAVNGMDCSFPFKRPGSDKVYTELAPGTVSNKHWCATSVKGDNTYDTWSYARKDDCDFENVEDLFEMFRPKEMCLNCIDTHNAVACTRPCVTSFNRFECFTCLAENKARACFYPCIGNSTVSATLTISEEDSESNVCNGTVQVLGPFGATGDQLGTQTAFDDRTLSENGAITKIQIRAGAIIDHIQITYGFTTVTHGGAGGIASPPVDPSGIEITKFELSTAPFTTFPETIQGLQFTTKTNEVYPAPGHFYGQKGMAPQLVNPGQGCTLIYLSGYTTGTDSTQKIGNYVSQLKFHWCCT